MRAIMSLGLWPLLAARYLPLMLTGGIAAVVGFLVWQGIAAWRVYKVAQACR